MNSHNHRTKHWSALFSFLYLILIGSNVSGSRLLVILLDGFRWDYLEQDGQMLPGFNSIFKQGVKAEYMVPVYPTLSYPNYYSIMTGVHSEDHGYVFNFMFDEKHGRNLFMDDALFHQEKHNTHWWDDAEPLWVTAENQGKKTYFFYWRECDVAIRGVKPTFCIPRRGITGIPEMQFSINESLNLLQNHTADFIGIYIEVVDHYGHRYGVGSKELKEIIKEVDREIHTLKEQMTSLGLDDVSLMIFSDHGMANIKETVDLSDKIDMNDISVLIPEGANIKIWPKDGAIDKVYDALQAVAEGGKITVYRKDKIPERYNLKRHYRVSPIFIEADDGVYITLPCKCIGCSPCTIPFANIVKYEGTGEMRGMHGYDNTDADMRAIFLASGPEFKKNYTSKPFYNVELYQLMCKILQVNPNHHNGTWSNVSPMLSQQDTLPYGSITDEL
ncbi:glycerophosphocholine cholinephosphodiesterase ENPP6-like [Saccostrea echinata]|uniref:glycerophosphocholine cholinephosphodiesterase ENPP6-like n=1 Tax=Saccostrea echinata TaxID=191078 RepID=UPI002A804E8D|nr:glycerophosphocholine cholinephosphodiesterase ENPP6-like [Saccostrea echinata]